MGKSILKLDTRRRLKDGGYPIVVSVGHGLNMLISTGISAKEDEWNQKSQLFAGKLARSVNSALGAILAATEARALELKASGQLRKLDKKRLRAALSGEEASELEDSEPSVGEMFRRVAAAKSASTARLYKDTAARLGSFCDLESLKFGDVNKMWLDQLAASMGDLSPNTISIHMRNLRAVFNYAIDCEVTSNYPFRRYKIPHQKTRKRAFGAEVIKNLYELDAGRHGAYRDIFMLTFFLVGINFIDLCGLKTVEGGRVEYVRAKTHKPYSLKVEPEAMEIIERLRGEGQLLCMLDNHKNYRSYYRQLRRGLEAVKSLYNDKYPDAPISELTTYWARHSWATIARSIGVSIDDIALALGHGDGHDTTHIYLDEDLRKIDEANRRVIDWVLYGKK